MAPLFLCLICNETFPDVTASAAHAIAHCQGEIRNLWDLRAAVQRELLRDPRSPARVFLWGHYYLFSHRLAESRN